MEVGMKTSMVGVKEGEACAWERRVSACSTSPGYHPVTLPQSGARPKVDLCASGAKKALARRCVPVKRRVTDNVVALTSMLTLMGRVQTLKGRARCKPPRPAIMSSLER